LRARVSPICPAGATPSLFSRAVHNASDNRQDGPTGGGSYRLADDGADVEAPQGWDQGLKKQSTDNATYCSCNRVPGAEIEVLEKIACRIPACEAGNEPNDEINCVGHDITSLPTFASAEIKI